MDVERLAADSIRLATEPSHYYDALKLLNPLLENIPLRRLGQPADVAGLAAFLASSDADYITGASVVIDGGLLLNYSEQ